MSDGASPSTTSRKPQLPWAHLLTGTRLALIAPASWVILQQHWWTAAALFTVAAVSDYYDGRIARARGQQSNFGGLFDHATDALFVAATLWALSTQQLVQPLLPWLVLAAFTQYSLDSKALAGAKLRANWLGRSNGIAYFVLVGVGIGTSILALPAALPYWSSWLLLLSTGLSMCNRAYYYWRHRQ